MLPGINAEDAMTSIKLNTNKRTSMHARNAWCVIWLGIEIVRQPGLDDGEERDLPWRGEPEDLLHAQLASSHAIGEAPGEGV